MTLSIKSFWLILLIVLTGIVGQWMGGSMVFVWQWFAALFILAVTAEKILLPANKYCIERKIPEQILLGESVDCELKIKNDGRRPVNIEVQADFPILFLSQASAQRYYIPVSEYRLKTSELIPVELGVSGLGVLHTRVLGLLGLVWWYRPYTDDVSTQCVPACLEHDTKIGGSYLKGSCFSHRVARTGLELLSHREYQAGDSLQAVDWKATARSNKMMVKVYSREQSMELAIMLDCGRSSQLQAGKLSLLRHNTNVVSRLAELAVRHDDHISCISYAHETLSMVPLTAGINGLRKVRQLLEKSNSISIESNPLHAALHVRRFLRRRALVLMLTDITNADNNSQFWQAVQLLSVKHHVVIASISEPEINNLRWSGANKWLDPYRSYAAVEYCRQRDLAIMRLKKTGASVISALPEDLDSVVLSHYHDLRQRFAI